MSGTKGRVTPRAVNVVAMMAATFIAILLLTLHVATAGAAPACTDDFIGPSGGAWSIAGNWQSATDPSTHALPGDADVVCLGGTNVVVNSGTADADSVQGQGGGVQLNGGTLVLFSTTNSSTIASLEIDQQSRLSAPVGQTVNITGNVEWGTCSCNSEQVVQANINQTAGPSGSFEIDGPGTGLGGPILNSGSITTDSPVTITNPAFEADGSTSITTTSTITLGTEVQMLGNSPQVTFTANGIVLPNGNAGFGPSNLLITGGTTTIGTLSTLWAGAITLQGGVLDDDGGIQAAPGDSQSLSITGGLLKGQGNMQGPVTNVSGTVTPGDANPGTLTMSGSYTQDADGALDINISASHSGLLQVEGAVSVAGYLVVNLGSYTPQPGQMWVVVSSLVSRSGTFTLSGPGASLVSPKYLSQSVQLGPATAGTTTTTTTTSTTGGGSTSPGTTTTGTTTVVNGGPGSGTPGGSTGTSPTDSTSSPSNLFSCRASGARRTGVVTVNIHTHASGRAMITAMLIETIRTEGKHHKTKLTHRSVTYAHTTTVSIGAKDAETVKLTPIKAALAHLRSVKHETVSLTVKFTPTGGQAASHNLSVNV